MFQQAVAVPGGLPAERTLALITVHSSQRAPDTEHARLMPVFTDRERFVRSAGLRGTDEVYAVVINRQGEVPARAEGAFDAAKADKLRETLQPQDAHEASRPPAGASPKVK
ncbi:MAG: hypothetical protein PSV40_19165 [Polaromonas sp.]|uniref:hypothetical protein n=1 Tax=Polaromonas sp. TaxID=1869339 RepID=UPI0024886A25|nr:hypothetical protein [Polaromonas sp.]MDI1271212.1 hypothetical protein [Polaromonas sp.]